MPKANGKHKRQHRRKSNAGPSKSVSNAITIAKPTLVTIPGLAPMPRELRTQFRYAWNSQISSTVQSLAAVPSSYRLNSMYDPDAAVGGGQPLFFDQLMALYRQYRVVTCYATVRFTNPTTTDLVCGVRVSSPGLSLNTAGMTENHLREQRMTWVKTISSTGSRTVEFKLKLDLHTIFGISKATLLAETDYKGYFNSNPVTMAVIDPFVIRRNAAVGVVDFSINLLYKAHLGELIQPAQST